MLLCFCRSSERAAFGHLNAKLVAGEGPFPEPEVSGSGQAVASPSGAATAAATHSGAGSTAANRSACVWHTQRA